MHSAEELFFLVLLFSVLFSASLPRNRTRQPSKKLPLPPVPCGIRLA